MFSCFCDCFRIKPKKTIKPLEGITIVKNDNSKEEIIFNDSYYSFTNEDFIDKQPESFYLNKKALEYLNNTNLNDTNLNNTNSNNTNSNNTNLNNTNSNNLIRTKSLVIENCNIINHDIEQPKEIKQSISDSEIIKKKKKTLSSSSISINSVSNYGFENIEFEFELRKRINENIKNDNNKINKKSISISDNSEWDDVFL